MYSVSGYGRMIADKPRMAAYAEALRRAVQPGSVVADIGAGTGVMTLLACQLGARRVFAIEPDPVIQVAREVIRENGFGGHVEFFEKVSTEVELPERASVIVSDLRGVLPFFGLHLPAMRDARERLLAPDGILISRRDTLWAAPVEASEAYGKYVDGNGPEGFDFHFEAARRRVTNTWWRARVLPPQLLADAQPCGEIDYMRFVAPNLAAELSFRTTRPGTMHGLALWFDAELVEGIGFSNSPSAPELIYGNAFFPMSEPVAVSQGEEIRSTIRADLIGNDYVWRWDTSAKGAQFAQSTFYSNPLSPQQLRKQSAGHIPALNEEGEVDLFILGLLAAGTPLGEIAKQAAARFPRRFASQQQALTRVGEMSMRYSR